MFTGVENNLLKQVSYKKQNLHWKLGQQTPSAAETLLAYLETKA